MSIPLLLVCDGTESKQATLEGLVKNEPGLKYIATASMQEGTRAVERAVKVGAKLVWIDLDEEPVEGLNLLAETRKLHPMLNVIVSRSQLDPDMVRAALQLGALDFLDPARAAQQLNVVVENLKVSSQGQSTSTTSQSGVSLSDPQSQTMAPQSAVPGNHSLSTGGGGKWADLDSIPTPGTKGLPPFNQDVTGEIHVAGSGIQDLVASQSAPASAQLARQTAELPASGSKWGDLDSIPTPAAAGSPASGAPATAQNAPPATFTSPPVFTSPNPPGLAPVTPSASAITSTQMPAVAPMPAAAPPPTAAPMRAAAPPPTAAPMPPATPPPTSPPASAAPPPAPGPGAAPVVGSLINPNNPNGGRWGDLDAIPTPKAVQEASTPKPTGEIAKPLSALDSIPSPSDRPPLPKPEPHINTNKTLRPSPEKAELYTMGSPVMMAVVIIVIIFAAIAFMYFKQHH